MANECLVHKRVSWIHSVVTLVAFVGIFGVIASGYRKDTPPKPDAVSKATAHASASRSPSALPRLLDLGADACAPCKKMVPVLDELEKEYEGRLEVQFIDAFKYPKIAKDYGVRTIPLQIFFDPAGKELYRHEGFIAKADILKKSKELGIDLSEGDAER